jgi:hypothetical protein
MFTPMKVRANYKTRTAFWRFQTRLRVWDYCSLKKNFSGRANFALVQHHACKIAFFLQAIELALLSK